MTEESNDQKPKYPQLTMRDAEDLTAAIADVAVVGLPLAEGLRAAATETRNRRVAAELRWIASQIESGRPVEDVLGAPQLRLPGYVAGLIRAALRTGRLGEVLVELVDHQQTVRDMWRTTRAALAYPMALFMLALAIGLGVEVYLVGPMCAMFEEFGLVLPTVTEVLIWGHREGIPWLLGTGAVFVLVVAIFRLFGGRARWRRCLSTVPIIGVLWHWSGVAELSRVLAVLTEQDIPLPEALRLAADGVHDANMSEVSRDLAAGVEQGSALSEGNESAGTNRENAFGIG